MSGHQWNYWTWENYGCQTQGSPQQGTKKALKDFVYKGKPSEDTGKEHAVKCALSHTRVLEPALCRGKWDSLITLLKPSSNLLCTWNKFWMNCSLAPSYPASPLSPLASTLLSPPTTGTKLPHSAASAPCSPDRPPQHRLTAGLSSTCCHVQGWVHVSVNFAAVWPLTCLATSEEVFGLLLPGVSVKPSRVTIIGWAVGIFSEHKKRSSKGVEGMHG